MFNNWKDFVRGLPGKKQDVASAGVQEQRKHASDDADASSFADPPRQSFADRVASFENCLECHEIPLNTFRQISFGGIPDKNGIRSKCWKVLLGYLPASRALWNETLAHQRACYDSFASELIVNPYKQLQGQKLTDSVIQNESEQRVRGIQIPVLPDNPLEPPSGSVWNEFFNDQDLRDDIIKDVVRTHAGLDFFRQRIDYSIFSETEFTPNDRKQPNETHHQVLSRILFIFGKLNPGVRYVQGMNELLAPIYYVFAQDPDPSFRFYAEADSFFCFTTIMSELKDRFIASMDSADSGIVACIEEFRELLRHADPELYLHLESSLVDPRYYSLRWFTLLCSQEFSMPDILRLWDSLLSDPRRFDFLQYTCCSMLICIRSKLLLMSYADIIQTLQEYPQTEMADIVDGAVRLRAQLDTRLPFSEKLKVAENLTGPSP